MGALDDGAYLAEFNEELWGVGGDDEDVGVGLDEDAGVLLIGLAEVFARGYGLIDLLLQVGGGGDAGAVAADSAEGGQGLAVGPEVAWLALALNGHGEHDGEGVFACSGGAGEDEGVGKATGGDGGAEVFDGCGVAEEVVEGGEGCCDLGHPFSVSFLWTPGGESKVLKYSFNEAYLRTYFARY